MNKVKYFLGVFFLSLVFSLSFGLLVVKADYTSCCTFSINGSLKKCTYATTCGAHTGKCLEWGSGPGGSAMCTKYESTFSCDTACGTQNGICPIETSYSMNGSQVCSVARVNVPGVQVSCAVNETCKKAFLDSIYATWTDSEPRSFVIGESNATIRTNISLKVKGEGGGDVGPVQLSCLNCDSQYVPEVVSTGNQISLTVNTAKLFEVLRTKSVSFTIVAKIDGGEVSRHDLVMDFKTFDCSKYNPPCSENASQCFPFDGHCYSKIDETICEKLNNKKELCGTQEDGTTPGSTACFWDKTISKCVNGLTKGIVNDYQVPDGYNGPLPNCAFSGTCKNINDLLELLIKFGKVLFSVIGMWAFIFFVYGGFTMITSFGSAEKVKKGRDMLIAAIVGLVIVFAAYLLINFMLNALNVPSDFRVVQ